MLVTGDLLEQLASKCLNDNIANGGYGSAVAVEFEGKYTVFFIKQQGLGVSAANSFGDIYATEMRRIFSGADDGTVDMAFAHSLTDGLTDKLTREIINAYARYWAS